MRWLILFFLLMVASPALAVGSFSLEITPSNPTTNDEVEFKLTFDSSVKEIDLLRLDAQGFDAISTLCSGLQCELA